MSAKTPVDNVVQLGLFELTGKGSQTKEADSLEPDAQALFEQWLLSRKPPLRKSTMQIYSWLWRRFIRSMQEQGISFLLIEPADIRAFLMGLDIKRPQRERYYQLIAKAFDELTVISRVPTKLQPNTLRVIEDPYRRTWRNAQPNDPTHFVPKAMWEKLEALCQEQAQAQQTCIERELSFNEWKAWRDLCLISLFFDTGLRAGELTVLSVSCILDEPLLGAVIDVGQYHGLTAQERAGRSSRDPHRDAIHAWRGQEKGARRKIPLSGWCARLLQRWIHHQQSQCAISMRNLRLFPGTRKPGVDTLISMPTLSRAISDWGEKYLGYELTAQRLRNTYGARLIEKGASLEEIEQLMGYTPGAASAWRLKQSWLAFCAHQAQWDARLGEGSV